MHPQSPSFSRFIPGIIWFFVVLVLLCMPGRDLPETGWLDRIHFDKFVHAVLFGGIVLGFAWPYRRSNLPETEKKQQYLRLLLATIVWGLATEFIQKYLIPGRSFDLADWLADALGAGLAYAACRRGGGNEA
jgi:hypothetical protein